MNDKEIIQYIRTVKKEGSWGVNQKQVIQTLQQAKTAAVLEKVGYLAKEVTLADWNQDAPATLRPIKIAILSNFTCDAIAHMLRTLLVQQGIVLDVYVADFNQYIYEMLNEKSGLYAFQPDITLCLLDAHIILDDLSEEWDVDEIATIAEQKVSELHQLISRYQSLSKGLFVTNTIPMPSETYQMIIDYKSKASFSKVWRTLNTQLLTLAEEMPQVVTIDMEVISQQVSEAPLLDQRLAYYAGMYMGPELLATIAKEMVKISRAVLGQGKKCLVLDLDNTLWGGIIGDDGLNGIQLGDSAPGKIFVHFQKAIKKIGRQGVLLTINSKNEESNVMEALEKHPDMQLRPKDFVVICANWEVKHGNIEYIAKLLNIGLDSLVFVDDNPFERNMVREHLPMVSVPEMPEDPSYYLTTLVHEGYFNTISLTKEDQKRTQQYKEIAQREMFRTATASVEEYLEGLNIELYLLPPEPFYLPRLAQLNVRTNQFNMTTRRYQEAEMESMANSDDFLIIGFQTTDRFGDNGLIGSVIIEKISPTAWTIRNFLMSCRVFSRSIETAVLRHILKLAQEQQVQEVFGEYIPSPKNGIVKDFYPNHGFELVEEDGELKIFRHSLQEIGESVSWITMHLNKEAIHS
ncbi:HAD-IIIC family phosphatase [Brevibacillus dissolubilis]|uniref:HAD-IIIC family phosphatase n=1 Tax=Brevibacillus dissolubilis TaxID=1844116 RepID=UPI001116B8E3|nr:HAD-IIIC family phosphatase [Brevibacillus dissolubilis]